MGNYIKKLNAWLENKKRTISEGIELIKEKDSKHITYLRKNEKEKQGSYAFNLLESRVKREIRIASQNSKKKDTTEVVKMEKSAEELEAEKQAELLQQAKNLFSQAKAAKTRADKALELIDKETDEAKKKKLEEKAEASLQKAEDAMKKAKEFSTENNISIQD